MAMVNLSVQQKNQTNRFRFDVRKLNKKLKTLESKVEKKITRQALRAGAKVIAKEAKAQAPVGPARRGHKGGYLRSRIKVWALKRSRNKIGVLVGTDSKWYTGGAFYGAFLEFGTSKMEPRPWLRPAAEAKGAEAAKIVERTIAEGIEREINNLKGK